MITQPFSIAILGTRFGEPNIEAECLTSFDVRLNLSPAADDETLIAAAGDAVAVLAGAPPKFNRTVLTQLMACQTIVRYGVGVETVDLGAATELGIIVANVPDYCTEEVATHTLALLLAATRKLALADRVVRSGGWGVAELRPLYSTEEQTLGIIGFGKIGQAVARKARPFGFEILVYDPYADESALDAVGAQAVPLDELLAQADAVTMNAPLNKDTHHLVDASALSQMKANAILVNTGRGGLIDEEALASALSSGKIAMAALDVLEKEPMAADNPLRGLENALITPHTAWYTEQAGRRMRQLACEEVGRVLRGEWPRNLVNPAVKEVIGAPKGIVSK